MSIEAYFADLERVLVGSDVVSMYVVLQQEFTAHDGKLRVRARLRNGSLLEFFEYVSWGAGAAITRQKYSYHWHDAQRQFHVRWDNVAHHPDLPNAPHHIHLADGSVEGIAYLPDLTGVIAEIEAYFRAGGLI